MSPAEYIAEEELRKQVAEASRRVREATLHKWVASGQVIYNVTSEQYFVGPPGNRVSFDGFNHMMDTRETWPSEKFIAELALAIAALPPTGNDKPFLVGWHGAGVLKKDRILAEGPVI